MSNIPNCCGITKLNSVLGVDCGGSSSGGKVVVVVVVVVVLVVVG